MRRIAAGVIASALAIPGVAPAQENGATVGASVAAATLESRTELAISGAFGYRVTRVVGLEIEATYVPSVDSPLLGAAIQGDTFLGFGVPAGGSTAQFVPAIFSNASGRLVVISNHVRVELPTTMPRLTPYFVAGGGVANLRRTARLTLSPPVPPPGIAVPIPVRPIVEPVSFAETDLALTLGGGLAIGVASHVSVDADLRYFRLLGNQDRNVGRFGAGVRYRF